MAQQLPLRNAIALQEWEDWELVQAGYGPVALSPFSKPPELNAEQQATARHRRAEQLAAAAYILRWAPRRANEDPMFLNYAAEARDPRPTALLLKYGADPRVPARETRSSSPTTPLHTVVNAEAAQLLIDAGADVNCELPEVGTPLYQAVRNARADVAEVLLKAGADVTWTGETTLLHTAATRGNARIVAVLAKWNLSPGMVDKSGDAPLHVAASVAVIRQLVAAGADVNVRDREGRTPSHRMVDSTHLKHLGLDNPADLHHSQATEWLMMDLCESLIFAGAEVNVRDQEGHTPLDLAISKNLGALAAFLRRHGGLTAGELDSAVPEADR